MVTQTGSQADFETWVEPSLGPMRALARRLTGSKQDAEDVVQEVLLRAWRKQHTYDEQRGSVTTWLLAITANMARRRARRPLQVEPVEDWRDEDSHLTAMVIERAIARLSSRQRLAVELHYFIGLSVAETAAVLGVHPGTVKSQLFDARTRLRAWLEETS